MSSNFKLWHPPSLDILYLFNDFMLRLTFFQQRISFPLSTIPARGKYLISPTCACLPVLELTRKTLNSRQRWGVVLPSSCWPPSLLITIPLCSPPATCTPEPVLETKRNTELVSTSEISFRGWIFRNYFFNLAEFLNKTQNTKNWILPNFAKWNLNFVEKKIILKIRN